MIDKSNVPKNINESKSQKETGIETNVDRLKDATNSKHPGNNAVSPFTLNLTESHKNDQPLASIPHQLLESNQRLTDFTSSDVNNTSGYNNRVTAATTVDIG